MSEDKTNNANVDNDELTDDELESVTGGRRVAAVAVGSSIKNRSAAAKVSIAAAASTAVGNAKQIAGAVNLKNIQTSLPSGIKPGSIGGALDDRE